VSQEQKERDRIHRIVLGALRETIRAHGPITKLLIGSAAKRISGTILASEKTNGRTSRNHPKNEG